MRFIERRVAAVARADGVILYPTEGVWGIGCRADCADAVQRVLALKRRDWRKGLILLAADRDMLLPWMAESGPLEPGVTWIVSARPSVPALLRGAHESLAVRITEHPPARALVKAVGVPLVSTSANVAGRAAPTSRLRLDPDLVAATDAVFPAATGALGRPTPIRDARTGLALR